MERSYKITFNTHPNFNRAANRFARTVAVTHYELNKEQLDFTGTEEDLDHVWNLLCECGFEDLETTCYNKKKAA